MRSNVRCMPARLLLAVILFLVLWLPVNSQGPIYLPVIEANMIKPLRSTIAITIPEEDQNYILNPSGEIAGNFAALAGTTVTRVTTYQKYGLYSYEVNSNADNEGMTLTLLAYPNAQAFVTVRARGQLPPAWDTSLDNTNYYELRLLEKIDANWNLYGAMIPASQANGSTTLYIRQNGTGSGLFYLDGIQVSSVIDGRYYTTYIDGTQGGCSWLGAPNASASTRSGDSRAGGVVTSFWEGFNFFPEKALGMGTTPEELNIDSYAFLPGGELNSSKIPPREFTIIGYFLADTVEELHEHAQRLELELGLNTYPARQAVRLRYSGARVLKEISANYTGGLEGDLPIYYNDDWSQEDEAWVRNYKFKMRASIQWVALDPFWYEVGESATLLDTNDSATFRGVAGRLTSTGQWSPLGPPSSAGTVSAVAEDDTYIYFAGSFTNFNGNANSDRIVRYNKQTGVYSSLSTGADGTIEALAIGPDGRLYAAGGFANIGGIAANRVAVWDGSVWDNLDLGLGGGVGQDVFCLAFGPDGLLYAGGAFTALGSGGGANRIAVWDGSVWAALGSGLGAGGTVVNSIVVSQTNIVYVSGSFSTAGGNPANMVAQWDVVTSTWSALGSGMTGNVVYALALAPNGLLYAAGDYDTADGITVNNIAVWNGSVWTGLGDGVNDQVRAIAIGLDGTLYAGGLFTVAGTITVSRAARWNGYTWAHLDIVLPGTPTIGGFLPSKFVNPVVSKNYNLWVAFNQNGTGTYAGLETILNEGTISAFPKISYTRSGGTTATIRTLRNERTGRELLFNYALLNGESLTIDLNPKNRTIVSSFFGTRMDAILANSDFSTWQLLPGNNDITSFVSESGSPTITAYLLFREPYRGWN